ncbi:hypothetical protein B0H10DRAFT_2229602 [Mycena sp. CBHHK59/15]|nr:hypothetical protein B0H10DRAFT_2229602 [Mycena sp. CBHHK59/15]
MSSESLKRYFYRGEKKNSSMWHTHCKACVEHHLQVTGATMTDLTVGTQAYKDALAAVPSTRSEKSAWIAHLIGGNVACPHASAQAKADATAQRNELQQESAPESKKRARTESTSAAPGKAGPPPKKQYTQSTLSNLTFRRNDMPFRTEERDAFQHQALRAIVSSGAPFVLFEDPEMRILFGMLRTTAPEILPSGKVLGGRLLNGAAQGDANELLLGH